MTTTTSKKAPVADVLGGDRDEGQNHTSIKEQNMHQSIPTRLNLDGFTTDIEPIEGGIAITFRDKDRWVLGMAITRSEARKLATALLDASAPDFGYAPIQELEEHSDIALRASVDIPVSNLATGTVTDIFKFAREHGLSTRDVMAVVENYINDVETAEGLTPAKWSKRYREQREAQ